jgi:hypothetical protein
MKRERKAKSMIISCTRRDAENRRYVPPPIGNGDLSLQIDYCGSMLQEKYSGGMIPLICRAGVRYDLDCRPLVSFGAFQGGPEGAGEVVDWEQSLDPHYGVVASSSSYADGRQQQASSFCLLDRNLIVLRRRHSGGGDFVFKYTLKGRRMLAGGMPESGIDYHIDGQEQYRGKIYLFADQPLTVEVEDRSGPLGECDITWTLRSSAPELTLFMSFDACEPDKIRALGYETLLAEQRALWDAYWDEGWVELPEKKLQEVYATAQYHLRINATRWSMPVGIFQSHWHGRYFAFDEMFMFRGLLSSGHLEIARRVPEFRRSHLEAAKERAYRYFNKAGSAALFVWETVEAAGVEAAPPGFWLEHIFHMSTIACCAHDYYRYSGDEAYLRDTGYPLLRACAEYFRVHAIYEESCGRIYVGKCTDLERLGAARENAYMTSCGAINTLMNAAEAADLLAEDKELAGEWRRLAEGLRRHLPHDGEKYIPYPGCKDKSVAVFSAVFPFPALPLSDPLQRRALDDFLAVAEVAGNMYPVGTSVCAWYASWMAIVYARLGDGEAALTLLRKAAEATGCFSEIFEIYETGHHPWFTTAEGSFVQAINELLLQDGRVSPALPAAWEKLSYKLPGLGGKTIQVQG